MAAGRTRGRLAAVAIAAGSPLALSAAPASAEQAVEELEFQASDEVTLHDPRKLSRELRRAGF